LYKKYSLFKLLETKMSYRDYGVPCCLIVSTRHQFFETTPTSQLKQAFPGSLFLTIGSTASLGRYPKFSLRELSRVYIDVDTIEIEDFKELAVDLWSNNPHLKIHLLTDEVEKFLDLGPDFAQHLIQLPITQPTKLSY
jgi:hypothetical protein